MNSGEQSLTECHDWKNNRVNAIESGKRLSVAYSCWAFCERSLVGNRLLRALSTSASVLNGALERSKCNPPAAKWQILHPLRSKGSPHSANQVKRVRNE